MHNKAVAHTERALGMSLEKYAGLRVVYFADRGRVCVDCMGKYKSYKLRVVLKDSTDVTSKVIRGIMPHNTGVVVCLNCRAQRQYDQGKLL